MVIKQTWQNHFILWKYLYVQNCSNKRLPTLHLTLTKYFQSSLRNPSLWLFSPNWIWIQCWFTTNFFTFLEKCPQTWLAGFLLSGQRQRGIDYINEAEKQDLKETVATGTKSDLHVWKIIDERKIGQAQEDTLSIFTWLDTWCEMWSCFQNKVESPPFPESCPLSTKSQSWAKITEQKFVIVSHTCCVSMCDRLVKVTCVGGQHLTRPPCIPTSITLEYQTIYRNSLHVFSDTSWCTNYSLEPVIICHINRNRLE